MNDFFQDPTIQRRSMLGIFGFLASAVLGDFLGKVGFFWIGTGIFP